jgi:hypothetical protein
MKNFDNNIIYNKSFNFALDVIGLYEFLFIITNNKENILQKKA